ncbi:hypothetical protein L9E69_001473 [Klebsiella aerogenes]|nr:hypothetical protein [Klebsiella aerogenes]
MSQGLKFLIKTVSCVLLVGGISILVSGCADQRYKPTECTVTYKINTYPVNRQYQLKINAVRYDRFGRMQVRVAPGQAVRPVGHWLATGFTNKDCK